MNDFEHDLRRTLDDLAGGVEPSAGLEPEIARRVRARQRRPVLAATGGVGLAVVLIAAVLIPRLGAPDSATVAAGLDGSMSATTAAVPTTGGAPGPTATTSAPPPTAPAPLVAPSTPTTGPTTTSPATTVAPSRACAGRAPTRSTVLPVSLPRELYRTGSVWDGRYAYLLGGMHALPGGVGYSDEVVRFEPETRQVTTLSGHLPAGIGGAAAVWDGAAAYLFGGFNTHGGYWTGIVRYEPSTGRSEVLRATLPFGLSGGYAFWDGRHAYVLGGSRYTGGNWAGEFDGVIRFTPATGDVRLLSARVAESGATVKAAAWDGRRILIVAGPREVYFYTPVPDARVLAFDPSTGAVSPLPGSFPVVAGAQAVWACGKLLLFGGTHETGDDVLSYDPASGGLSTLAGSLPQAIGSTAVVWDGQAAFVLGGLVNTGPATAGGTSQIVRFG